MAEFTIPTLSNSLVPVRSSPGGGGASLGEVALLRLPARFQALSHPFVVTGKISGHNPDGSISLSTRFGELILRAGVTLTDGVVITVQIPAGRPPRRGQAFAGVHPELARLESGARAGGSAASAGPAAGTGGLGAGFAAAGATAGSDPAVSAGAAEFRDGALRDTPPELILTINPDAQGHHQPRNDDDPAPGDGGREGEGLLPGSRVLARYRPDWPADSFGMGGPAPDPSRLAPVDPDIRIYGDPGFGLGLGRARADRPTSGIRPQGTVLTLRVLAITLPAAAQALDEPGTPADTYGPEDPGRQPPAGPLGARFWEGRVIGTTADGHPIVRVGAGAWELQRRSWLPAGTIVRALVLERTPEADGGSDPASGDPPDRATIGGIHPRGNDVPPGGRDDWSVLRQTIATLALVDPAAAEAVRDQAIPQPDDRLAAALLFFLGGLRDGDARAWLGESAVAALERSGQSDLLAELGEDFRSRASAIAETPADQWQVWPVPLLDGNRLLDLTIQVRHPDDEGSRVGATADERPCRFLVDVTFSRIGPVQIDGLVKAGRFHMIIRTIATLPLELRQELHHAFTACLEAAGLAGGLSFQDGRRGWISTDPPAPPPHAGQGLGGTGHGGTGHGGKGPVIA